MNPHHNTYLDFPAAQLLLSYANRRLTRDAWLCWTMHQRNEAVAWAETELKDAPPKHVEKLEKLVFPAFWVLKNYT